mgnify:CR=1 FL=1
MDNHSYEHLEKKAKQLRKATLDLCLEHNEAHIGGSLSLIEILLTIHEIILQKEDKFVLSKGHSSFPYYLVLREKGFDPHIGTHPEIDQKNGIHCTTGSLGHGLPISTGMALARKIKNTPGRIYVLMSDGECQEGTTWESMLIAAHHKLDNLTVIVDYNKIQALSRIAEALSLHDLAEKWRAFGWHVQEANGHSFSELINALNNPSTKKPSVILAHTTKGKGVSCFEDDAKWHSRKPKPEEFAIAYKELS